MNLMIKKPSVLNQLDPLNLIQQQKHNEETQKVQSKKQRVLVLNFSQI